MRWIVALALVLLLAWLPTGAGQAPDASFPTTLYFHLLGDGDSPINTQEPDPAFEKDLWRGTSASVGCATDLPAGVAPDAEAYTWRGYLSPGLVDYGFGADGAGQPKPNAERGVGYDAIFDQAEPFTLTWYVLAGMQPAGQQTTPTALANVHVAATMRAGDAISVGNKAYDAGPVLAQGQTVAATLTGDQVTGGDGQVRAVMQRDGAWVYEFKVPMEYESSLIPRATGFNVRIDLSLDLPSCEGLMTPEGVAHTSALARPRMDFAITNPLEFGYLHPQFIGEDLVVHCALRSAWGVYDVDALNITLEVRGPGDTGFHQVSATGRTGEAYWQQGSLDVTFVWEGAARNGTAGLYEGRLTFSNQQGTASLTRDFAFEISPRQESPGVAPGLLLGALLGLALLGRQRL